MFSIIPPILNSLNFLFDISYLSCYRKLILLLYEIVYDVLIAMTLSVSVAATQKEKHLVISAQTLHSYTVL